MDKRFVKVLTAWALHYKVMWQSYRLWLPQQKCWLGEQ